jgi:hypothetical protein
MQNTFINKANSDLIVFIPQKRIIIVQNIIRICVYIYINIVHSVIGVILFIWLWLDVVHWHISTSFSSGTWTQLCTSQTTLDASATHCTRISRFRTWAENVIDDLWCWWTHEKLWCHTTWIIVPFPAMSNWWHNVWFRYVSGHPHLCLPCCSQHMLRENWFAWK